MRPPALPLLAWYDRHRRTLPWRATGAAMPDPYAVWLSEVMLQQTTVAAVKGFYARFLALWPDVAALAAALHVAMVLPAMTGAPEVAPRGAHALRLVTANALFTNGDVDRPSRPHASSPPLYCNSRCHH